MRRALRWSPIRHSP